MNNFKSWPDELTVLVQITLKTKFFPLVYKQDSTTDNFSLLIYHRLKYTIKREEELQILPVDKLFCIVACFLKLIQMTIKALQLTGNELSFGNAFERRRSRVVIDARLWSRKPPKDREIETGFRIRQLENSLCRPSSKWDPFQIREGLGSERRGMNSAFHLLCPGYNGPPYGPFLREIFTFFTPLSIHIL